MTPSLNENAERNGKKEEDMVGVGMVIKGGRTFGGQGAIVEEVTALEHKVVITKGKDKGTVLTHKNGYDIYEPLKIIG